MAKKQIKSKEQEKQSQEALENFEIQKVLDEHIYEYIYTYKQIFCFHNYTHILNVFYLNSYW